MKSQDKKTMRPNPETAVFNAAKQEKTEGKSDQDELDEQGALHLTRSFWLAYNNINMYGDKHPQATRAVDAFHDQLTHQLEQHKRILFHIDQNGFLCGPWRMDRELRIMRLVERFTTSGIESVTFEPSVSNKGLGFFMTVLIDMRNFRNAKEIEGALKAAEANGIRINRHKYASVKMITDIGSIKEEKSAVDLTTTPESLPKVPVFGQGEPGDQTGRDDEEKAETVAPRGPVGNLDLGEISLDGMERGSDEPEGQNEPVSTWSQLMRRLLKEINQYKGAVDKDLGFDRFYEGMETVILHYLLDSRGKADDSVSLSHLVTTIEELDWKLLSELEGPLRDHLLLEGVGEKLKDRFVNRLAILWADTIWQIHNPLDQSNLQQFFTRVEGDLGESKAPQIFLQSLLYLLDERGLPDKLFGLIWERLVRKSVVEEAKPKVPLRLKLPKDIESRKEILRDVETEMYRHNRYTAPFSCLSISLVGIRSEPRGKLRSFDDEELDALYRFLAAELQISLRKLDRVGSLGPVRSNHLLVLLPMTDVTGAVVLMERLERRSEMWKVVSPQGFFYPELLFSSFTYNAEKVKDIKVLVRKIRSKHRRKEKIMFGQTAHQS